MTTVVYTSDETPELARDESWSCSVERSLPNNGLQPTRAAVAPVQSPEFGWLPILGPGGSHEVTRDRAGAPQSAHRGGGIETPRAGAARAAHPAAGAVAPLGVTWCGASPEICKLA